MTLTISENKKKAILNFISNHFNEHMSHFPYAKYPTEPLDRWREQFTALQAISPETIRAALSWRGGFWQRKDAPYIQRQTALIVVKSWAEFVEMNTPDPTHIFGFWTGRIGNSPLAFDNTAFITHLVRPDAIELADMQRLEAMQDLLKKVEHEEGERDVDCSLDGIVQYTDFFRALLSKLSAKYGVQARVKLDRFLKAYGNRPLLSKLAEKFPPTVEPMVRLLNWENIECKQFAPELIAGRANADVLFACLLLALDSQPEHKEKLTIREIVELIPLGSGDICNPGSYHYAMIALFGGQSGRDFFTFEDRELQTAFTKQANQSTRNMRFYLAHTDKTVSINPKYINKL